MTQQTSPQYPLVLVLDIGSSSTRAVLYDASATMVPGMMAREKQGLHLRSDGAAEDDPHALLSRVARCIDGLLARAGAYTAQIAAVGCATYAASVLGLDADGQPCTPVYAYADTRSDAAAEALRQRLDEAAILQRTGCPLRTSYLPALLTWLQSEQPALLGRVARWVSVGEWLFTTLFDRATISYSCAAWTGLLNRRQLQWDAELLAELPVRVEQLGALADVDQPFQGLQRTSSGGRIDWAARWPALAELPWFTAVGDGAAANLGSGCTDARHIALSIGTSGALRVVAPHEPQIPPGLWCYRVARDQPLLGGATSEGGNVLTWALNTLKIDAPALDQQLNQPSSTRQPLTVLPFIAGERSPGWSGAAQLTITGITAATRALDVARAALEGVTYRWAMIAGLLREATPGAPTLVASGGGLKYVPHWAQLIADAIGLPVALSPEPEATSRGVALLALRSIGQIRSLDQLPLPLDPAYLPDAARHAEHQAAIARQAALYQRLR
jgi:gluconokinase